MGKFKIGQVVENTERHYTRSLLDIDGNMTIEIGDRALVTRCGLMILSGEARGKIIPLSCFGKEVDMNKYDYANIAKFIVKALLNNTGIEEAMEDYDISDGEIREVIEDVLREII